MIRSAGVPIATSLLALLLLGGCSSDESQAAGEQPATAAESAEAAAKSKVDGKQEIAKINPAIPLYEGAQYRDDLSNRDEVMIRNQYGPGAQVYTLATDDSFPQVFHYYTTYLAQFRGFADRDRYPSEREQWRTLEVELTQAMQDPFIPGEALDPNGKQITLQIAETEAEPKTVIRYIVRPAGAPAPVVTAEHAAPAAPVAR